MRGTAQAVSLALLICLIPGQNCQAPTTCPSAQRCCGRNGDPSRPSVPIGRRCCTPANPCGEGEGDCNGAAEGPPNDGNRGCKAGLVCGSNNCKKFGSYYNVADDCCEKPLPATCPLTHNCCGRYGDPSRPSVPIGRRCCTPANPCSEGEGDCNPDVEGPPSDGNLGCKPGLVCGRNNCKKFGSYFHAKDDCCEKPKPTPCTPGWSDWSAWSCLGATPWRQRQRTCKKANCSIGHNCVVNGFPGTYLPQVGYSTTCP